jgi:hypothetical protein
MGQVSFTGITAQEKKVGDITITMQKDLGEEYTKISAYDELDIRLKDDNITDECYDLIPKYPQGCVASGKISIVNLKRYGTDATSSNYDADMKNYRFSSADIFYEGKCNIDVIKYGSTSSKLERFIIIPEYDKNYSAYYFDISTHTPSRKDLELLADPYFSIKFVQKITEQNKVSLGN